MFSLNSKHTFNLAGTLILLTFCLAVFNSCSQSDTETLTWNKKIAKTAVHNQAASLGQILKNMNTETDRENLIQTAIDSVRFYDDNSGYFYVYQFDCINVAHATQKDLVGKNLYDHQDTHGKYVIRELSATASNGGGFVEFYWRKPGASGEKRKMGYVEPIPGTDYFIGTGVYLE